MDQFLEWARSNWGETGLLGTWAGIIARLIWKNAGIWFSRVRRWFRSKGSTKTLGVVKHRDDDDDVTVRWEFMGRRFNIHSSGKYVDVSQPKPETSDQPSKDDKDSTREQD